MSLGCYNRFRETQKCPGSLRPRAGADDDQGNEAGWGDQATQGTCILEAKVGSSRFLSTRLLMFTIPQNGSRAGKAPYTPSQEVGGQVGVHQACGANGSGTPIHRRRAGENQSTKQESECVDQGRWPIDGHGRRLAFTSLFMYNTSMLVELKTGAVAHICVGMISGPT